MRPENQRKHIYARQQQAFASTIELMKKQFLILTATVLSLGLTSALAQVGGQADGPAENIFAKVFGTNLDFSANMVTDIKVPSNGNEMSMPGKIYFAGGNSRTEMNMAKMKGSKMPPHSAERMKAMGMDQMISIYRDDTKMVYMIYPGMHSYAEIKAPSAKQEAKSQVTSSDLGKETVDGYPCIKKKYHITNFKPGKNMTMIAWTATNLKNYPIKIEMNPPGDGHNPSAPTTTLHFTNINTDHPAHKLFEPPIGYHVYTNLRAMVQTELIRKMGGGNQMPPGHAGMPPGHPAMPPGHPAMPNGHPAMPSGQ